MAGGRVVVYQDYVCPYSYVAEAPLAMLRAEGVGLERRAYELVPAPRRLPDLRDPSHRAEWERSVLPVAERFGVEIRYPARSVRTRKAHEAAAFARSQGRLEEMHAAIFRGHFVDRLDIGRIDVLAELGGAVGLDAVELKVTLDVDRWTEHVVAEQAAGAAMGIAAVPALLRGGAADLDVLYGVREYETLRAWARRETWTEQGS
jgi:predicted DsbA family dithiol-disulfide isomerase